MSEKHNDPTRNRPDGPHIIDAPTVLIDINAYLQQVKSEESWSRNDRNSITVFKTGGMTVVVGAMHRDAEMLPHKAEGIMCLQVLTGSFEVTTDDTNSVLRPGHAVAIHKGCNYRVVALEEAAYMLTMTDVS